MSQRTPGHGAAAGTGRRASGREHDVRRLRDLLRAGVLGGAFAGGHLPSEAELMAGHGVTRATVREALALLRRDGLIERVQGLGTHALFTPVTTPLAEAHGAELPLRDGVFARGLRPRVLDESVIPAPALVADRLGVAPGTPVLRLDYVSLMGDEPHCLATNYVLFPEAARLAQAAFTQHWYAYLADAGVVLGESEFVFDGALADPVTARTLDVLPGTPLISMEQAIYDPEGRVFNVAFLHLRADRFRFASRATARSTRRR
ncbi:GntR family transcriptional regulator [Streptomyces hoynatensis]|uniref:GntR family transcriptional regulator n=1 Tax=Streptomyces hoynatensis TaxID=1141874 RepID=UPI0019D4144A|nr:GntR family transcriptional regulator [Streptomyces hoynatensis]